MRSLIKAINENDIENVKLILNRIGGGNINDSNSNGEYPFLISVARNNVEITKMLIDFAHKNNIVLEINKKKLFW